MTIVPKTRTGIYIYSLGHAIIFSVLEANNACLQIETDKVDRGGNAFLLQQGQYDLFDCISVQKLRKVLANNDRRNTSNPKVALHSCLS